MQTKFDLPVYTVYKTTNLINCKFYIGFHKTSDLEDSYLGSGVWLWRSIDKHGIQNFKKKTLFIFETAEEAYAKEKELVEEAKKDPLCMNLHPGGSGGSNGNFSEETLERMRLAALNRKPVSETTREKLRLHMLGRKHSLGRKLSEEHLAKLRSKSVTFETKLKISQALEGHKVSEETRLKLHLALRGRKLGSRPLNFKHSEETKAKISAANKGRVLSEESRKNISRGHMGHTHSEETKKKMQGRVVSEETREKLRESTRRRWEKQKAKKGSADETQLP